MPRDVLTTEYMGIELRGRTLWKKTLLQKAKNSPFIVSRRTEFSFRTLQNMLLARFHADLFREMKNLIGSISEDEMKFLSEWKMYTAYHQDFITTEIWSNLLEESLNIDFSNFEVLEQTRRTGKGEVAEILDLWEAYISNKTFLTDFGKRFDTALKPLSKIYELWCLKKICEVLHINYRRIRRFPCTLSFATAGQRHKLLYNTERGLKKYSGFIGKIGVGLGRPDFVIESGGRIVCIIDAKCKPTENLNTEDLQRLLSYVLDFIYPGMDRLTAIVLNISKGRTIKKVKARNCELYIVPMTPTSFPKVKGQMLGLVQSVLTTPDV
jgi:hypothetical protein